jgi:purine-binding chemotaxis protein CheW
MSGGLVDDYLSDLLGAVAAASTPEAAPERPVPPSPVAAAPPPPVAAPEPVVIVPASPDEISEDEFEALLDALHGEAAPGTVAVAPSPVAPSPAAAPANPDDISEDEFEALLDTLHGGKPPGAVAAAAAVAVAAAKASAAAIEAAEDEAASWRGQERRANRRSSRWLRMNVRGLDYAVELLKVQEVLLPVDVLAMRDTERAILGVMSLRGIVVPVLDIGLWLGLEEVEDTAQTRYVVLEQNGDCLALKVSAVLDVYAIADGEIEPPENTLASPELAMLKGVTRLNSQPVILLDAVGLLG